MPTVWWFMFGVSTGLAIAATIIAFVDRRR
jgi:hypothetical protein